MQPPMAIKFASSAMVSVANTRAHPNEDDEGLLTRDGYCTTKSVTFSFWEASSIFLKTVISSVPSELFVIKAPEESNPNPDNAMVFLRVLFSFPPPALSSPQIQFFHLTFPKILLGTGTFGLLEVGCTGSYSI